MPRRPGNLPPIGLLRRTTVPVTLISLFLASAGQSCAAAPPNLAMPPRAGASASALESPEQWAQFKTFWKAIDRQTGPMFFQQMELAKRFGMQEPAFLEALQRTERRATGTPGEQPGMPLGDYALASFAQLRIDASTFEEAPLYTRMMIPPPNLHVSRKLRDMETVDRRVDQLLDLKQRHAVGIQEVLTALEGIRHDVYHHCVLRAAAQAHARSHGERPPRKEGPPDKNLLTDFCWHPDGSVVGSELWLQGYNRAVQRILDAFAGSTDPEEKATVPGLKRKQQALMASLEQVDAFKPKLEALFADLEK